LAIEDEKIEFFCGALRLELLRDVLEALRGGAFVDAHESLTATTCDSKMQPPPPRLSNPPPPQSEREAGGGPFFKNEVPILFNAGSPLRRRGRSEAKLPSAEWRRRPDPHRTPPPPPLTFWAVEADGVALRATDVDVSFASLLSLAQALQWEGRGDEGAGSGGGGGVQISRVDLSHVTLASDLTDERLMCAFSGQVAPLPSTFDGLGGFQGGGG
jgi:hypothetical protein